ncbi:uncharacterized protein DMAD_07281 [Drosophila madeirensis]|uniref:Secreted protein n=1 Tax=Drosophila madeirensis TaxID=30013 RepID=A0AAU9FV47_DROMD
MFVLAFNLVLNLVACGTWSRSCSPPFSAMVLLKVIKYLVGCVARVCHELSQNMTSLNKMFKYHLLEIS